MYVQNKASAHSRKKEIFLEFFFRTFFEKTYILSPQFTPPNSEIICVQNVGAKVEMVSYLKKQIKIKILKRKRNPGSPLEVTC